MGGPMEHCMPRRLPHVTAQTVFCLNCTAALILVFLLCGAAPAAAQTVISTDKLIYEYGEDIDVTFQAPPPESEYDQSTYRFDLDQDVDLGGQCGRVEAGGSGQCSFSTMDRLPPESVTKRDRVYIYNYDAETDDPGQEHVVFIGRPVTLAPGVISLPNGRIYRPWDDIPVEISDADQFLEQYNDGYIYIRRTGRSVLGGAVSRYESPSLRYGLDRVTEGVNSYISTGNDGRGADLLPLGAYEMQLSGGDGGYILAREPFEVRLPDFSGMVKFANPLADGQIYDSENRPQIYVDLPEALMAPRDFLELAFVRLGPDGVPQPADSESLYETPPDGPAREQMDNPAPLTPEAAYIPQNVSDGSDPLKPGRYQARLYFEEGQLLSTRAYWLEQRIIVDTLDFTIGGALGPDYHPDPARQEIPFGDVAITLNKESYSTGETAEVVIVPEEGLDLSGETLWLSVHRSAWATFGCRLTEELLVGASNIFPSAGNDPRAWDKTSAIYGSYNPGYAAQFDLADFPTMEEFPTLGFDSFSELPGPGPLASFESEPLGLPETPLGPVETGPDENDLPNERFGERAFGIAYIDVAPDEQSATLDLAVYPGHYEVRLYRGRRSNDQPFWANDDDELPDSELLARTLFTVEARPQDLQISLQSPAEIHVDYSAHNYVAFDYGLNISQEEPPFDVEIALTGEGVDLVGPKFFLLWLGDKALGGAVELSFVEEIDKVTALEEGRYRANLTGVDGGQYIIQARDALNNLVFSETQPFTLVYDNYFSVKGSPIGWPAGMRIEAPLRSEWEATPIGLNIWAPDCDQPLVADAIPELRMVAWRPVEVLPEPALLDEDELSTPVPVGEYVAIDEVFYGHPFFVEAAFEQSQLGAVYTVTVGANLNVEVHRTEDNPLVYRSKAVVLSHEPGQGRVVP
jgi:hypothetical protein